MGQNLTCYMHIKTLLIILAVAIVSKIALTEIEYTGFLHTIIDNAVPIYLVISIIIDMYDIGRLKFSCLFFDSLIAFILYTGYFVAIVIVGYSYDMIIGFFKYVIF